MSRNLSGPDAGRIQHSTDFVGSWLPEVLREMQAAGLPRYYQLALADIGRGRRSRYGTTWIDCYIDAAAQVRNEAKAYALPLAIARAIRARRGDRAPHFPDVVRAFDREFHEANCALRDYTLHRTEPGARRVAEEFDEAACAAQRVRDCFAATSGVRR